jgi:hypothetical protein
MSTTPFTDHLRLGDGDSALRARKKLSEWLGWEMKVRGLRLAPPRLLGFVAATWDDRDAWDELVQECWVFAVEERRQSLAAQLLVKETIEGLVWRNVRNFLHELQRRNDPLGWRVYQLVLGAVEDRVRAGELRLDPGPGVDNDSVLAAPGVPLPGSSPLWPEAGDERIAAWSGELVRPLFTGRQGERLQADLGRRIVAFSHEFEIPWRFKDLLDALKREMRNHWHSLHGPDDETGYEGSDGEDGGPEGPGRTPGPGRAPVPVTRHRTPSLDRRDHLALERCVADGVRGSGDDRDREGLHGLWQYLRVLVPSGARRPSKRRLARTLDMPRGQVDRLLPRLEEIYRRCLEAVWGRAPYPDFGLT